MKTALRLTVAAFVLAAFNLSAATRYVSLDSPNPTPPYATWETAATNIQHAVDVAHTGDTVLVTNGVYAVGGRGQPDNVWWESRVVVTNSIRLESVNGPLGTIVQGAPNDENGQGATRCVYLGNNAVLSGFTLRGGSVVGGNGGGVYSESGSTVTNCILSGNTRFTGVSSQDWSGGGAYGVRLYNCLLTGNVSHGSGRGPDAGGGGAGKCTLYGCTLRDNAV